MKQSFLLFLFVFSPLIIFSQTISGVVIDEGGSAVPFANIALYSQNDSTLATGAVSDTNGEFKIETTSGVYFLRITFLSYQEKVLPNISVNNDIALGKIILKSDSKVLDEVVVQGEKSQMELYLDKRVFTVGKDLANISTNASDILGNVPSVTVDVDGNISLRGSENVRILIDGKPSGLTGINTADAMRQLPGNLIESIEVITNPSARYDAEGEVGIINIILKKERKKGVNGSFTANAGHPDNFGATYSINLRREKMNFFSNYGYNYRANPGSGKSFEQQLRDASTIAWNQKQDRVRTDRGHSFRAGMDYFFNDKNTLTGSFLIRNSDGLNTSTTVFDYTNEDNITDSTIVRKEREEEPELNTEFALNYRKEFNRKGQLLTADFKWIQNDETEKANFIETNDIANSTILQRSVNTENERNLLFQMDYTHPFARVGRFEAGVKSTNRVIDNLFRVDQQNDEAEWITDPDYNNDFVYTENIHAGYVMVGNELNSKLSWQMGLRGELTDIQTEFRNHPDKDNDQYYFNVFPSSHLSYKVTEEKTLQLSYSYRLSRPRFRDLLPYSGFSNNRILFVGNPNLRPEFTHSIEAGYLLNWEKGSILSSAYYRMRTGVRERIRVVAEYDSTIMLVFPINLAKENAYGLEFNFHLNPVDWFRLNANANFYRSITEGQYEDQELYADTYTLTSRTTTRFKFGKKMDFQASFNYRAPRNSPQGRNLAMYHIDLALSRDVLKNKGTITLSVNDLLNSRKWRWITDTTTIQSQGDFQWRSRQIILTINYRLNRKKDKGSENVSGGDLDGGDF